MRLNGKDVGVMPARLRTFGFGLAGLALIVALWEGYKVLGWDLLFRTDDQSMPHVSEMLSRFGDPENRGTERSVGITVLLGAWSTLKVALAGLALGSFVGFALAVVMQRWRVAERGVLPFVVISQTVPIVAIAPLVVIWGGRLKLFGVEWQPWMSITVIAAFLAFTPVAIGTLRGLQSPAAHAVELMRSLAAPERATLLKLRLPAAVPYIVPALKLAAAGAIVGAIVAEISIGSSKGIGRLILEYSREATSDPAKVYTAMFGAAGLGVICTLMIGAFEAYLMRNRPKEAL